jgi:hypothetical protein
MDLAKLWGKPATSSPPGKPVETPATSVKYTSTKMEFEMYEEVKRLAKILTKVGNFLQGQHPEILRTMEKMSFFDGTVDGSDLGSEEGSPSAFCNLDDALNSERERKPAAWREDWNVWLLVRQPALLRRKP